MISGDRNIALLATSQPLSAVVLPMTLAGILGAVLAPDKGTAMLPIAAMVVGTAIAPIPASMLTRRLGRRAGFLIGTARHRGQRAGRHRSAQAELLLVRARQPADRRLPGVFELLPIRRGRCLRGQEREPSHFLGGGGWRACRIRRPTNRREGTRLAAARRLRRFLHRPGPAVDCGLGSAVATRSAQARRGSRRAIAQPARVDRAALTACGGGRRDGGLRGDDHGHDATPPAILGWGFGTAQGGLAIQWHVSGMFAPSFFTGRLVARFGAPRVMQAGFLLWIGHVAIAVPGLEYLHFPSALVLLGVGWNFAFVGTSAMLTRSYCPSEQTPRSPRKETVRTRHP